MCASHTDVCSMRAFGAMCVPPAPTCVLIYWGNPVSLTA